MLFYQPQSALINAGLFEAADKGDFTRVEGLLAAGHHPDTHKDLDGNTPIHAAADKGHTDCLKALVTAGGNLTAKDNYGKSPLHMATFKNHYDTAQWIIGHPDGRQCLNMGMGFERKTPMKLASEMGNKELVKLLRENGGSMTALESGKLPASLSGIYGVISAAPFPT